jgi:hypothetical protein
MDSDQSIMQRLFGSGNARLPREVAQFFLNVSVSEDDLARIEALSAKANEGELTAEERDELSTYVLLNDFLAIMQSRARLSMKEQTPAA